MSLVRLAVSPFEAAVRVHRDWMRDGRRAREGCSPGRCDEVTPNFGDAWSNLASAYMRKGMLQEAAECCRHALSLNPRLVDAHSNLGNLLKAQGLTHHNPHLLASATDDGTVKIWELVGGFPHRLCANS